MVEDFSGGGADWCSASVMFAWWGCTYMALFADDVHCQTTRTSTPTCAGLEIGMRSSFVKVGWTASGIFFLAKGGFDSHGGLVDE